jgi:hypothetical protein
MDPALALLAGVSPVAVLSSKDAVPPLSKQGAQGEPKPGLWTGTGLPQARGNRPSQIVPIGIGHCTS